MKALLINGSLHAKGSTRAALQLIAESLEEEGVEAEIYQMPHKPIQGCAGCFRCMDTGENRCAVKGDAVNEILEKMEGSDALVLGSPVYYASPSGQILSALDRVFFAGRTLFPGKPAAAICVARRAGATAAIDVLQKYFMICGMPIAPSTYWPMVFGMSEEEIMRDPEGVQNMQMTGKTIAWLLKCIEAGKSTGVVYPDPPGGEKISTNFVR